MTKPKATPRTAAKKAADLIRQGKNLSSMLTVYERMLTGELACTQEGLKALQVSIVCQTGKIAEAVSN